MRARRLGTANTTAGMTAAIIDMTVVETIVATTDMMTEETIVATVADRLET